MHCRSMIIIQLQQKIQEPLKLSVSNVEAQGNGSRTNLKYDEHRRTQIMLTEVSKLSFASIFVESSSLLFDLKVHLMLPYNEYPSTQNSRTQLRQPTKNVEPQQRSTPPKLIIPSSQTRSTRRRLHARSR